MSDVRISEKNISESLRIILVKKNLNVARLSEIMGVSSTTLYSKFKRGNFSIKDLDEISKALNLTYEITFTMNDTNKNESVRFFVHTTSYYLCYLKSY